MKTTVFRLTVLVLFPAMIAFAQQPAVFMPDGKAIRGYDPVAYFTDGKPVLGNPSLSYVHEDATWFFSNQKHLDAFRANPGKYAPQYGGYCAFGLSRGYKAPVEPDAWTITDGKLYLNYNRKVRAEWDKDRPGYIQKADKNWPQVKNSK